ncbi:sesquipedalian-1 isoform X2 [Drosophila subpulchrella]|uniref:sesquipedalian-1 isoform X2 n=1 Tax=Drosophila subpulchrella TaxID=1486046 RepID=UPI0018A15237|nr:sesquipedalian-1 isoform X2 [Drosophila subpulchrella]
MGVASIPALRFYLNITIINERIAPTLSLDAGMKINERTLNVFAKTPPFDMEGFLNKRGEVNKAFQRRFFVLKGNLLFYFESRVDKDPLGLIIVEGCTIELSNEVDNYCFEIAFNGNRTYILSADNQESMETWMKALTCAGYEYKRIILTELKRQLNEMEGLRKILGNAINGPHSASEIAKPRPPPRRTNPFNRPAPPPPNSSLDGIMSPLPFINGYFGSGNARMQQDANVNGRPSETPREQRRPTAAPAIATNVFYPDAKSVGAINNNHITLSSGERRLRRVRALDDFSRNHERFRQELMPDVSAYRGRHGQPLIQL